jgi:uncharacterized membrane protein YedE/YeeE
LVFVMQLLPLLAALAGGLLIGAAALGLLALSGRVAGVSGIVGGLIPPRRGDLDWRLAYLAGLLFGGVLLHLTYGLPTSIPGSRTTLIVSGLLVGFGTRLGNGCTSGHGVCGLGRGSPRSFAAVLTFMAVAFITVFVSRHILGGAP